ncbi:hypothetical protein BaRGS_00015736 [Batillaria attramentaria]|uniref:Uncharacterized protein n=1 Tax=Batillaria attramentaria TaxID=370345 RepID=A0ABD0L0X8_9CAEN
MRRKFRPFNHPRCPRSPRPATRAGPDRVEQISSRYYCGGVTTLLTHPGDGIKFPPGKIDGEMSPIVGTVAFDLHDLSDPKVRDGTFDTHTQCFASLEDLIKYLTLGL